MPYALKVPFHNCLVKLTLIRFWSSTDPEIASMTFQWLLTSIACTSSPMICTLPYNVFIFVLDILLKVCQEQMPSSASPSPLSEHSPRPQSASFSVSASAWLTNRSGSHSASSVWLKTNKHKQKTPTNFPLPHIPDCDHVICQ